MAVGVVFIPIPNDTYKLGFIGSGKMAESITKGVVKSGVLPASRIQTAHLESSRRFAFESFGIKVFGRNVEIWKADEKLFDAITGLSGSGPAYIYLAIEALADGGVAAGLPRELALGLASQTVLGAASMVSKGGKHPGQLKDDVASPGGITIAGFHELEKGGFGGILMNAVVAATKRSPEFSKR
ncbi:hypothetical protein RHSIM_Rhsim13G0081800 [Rhododendron simsii]|uniref:Pyrroline-5-carboxylate reductase n=1 Tax=Rhododendron simsii TaxID=118357 RepID=A0A834G437_RHOSS|nr:hypothetical protein RHSIM_Rhsim13G0081800 [Rhododendron simsii]